ncbi:MAG: hypothetical protein LBJ82_02925 [Deltaproteobacteria bacterium]|nr:hypothetical protein [Deltaproteobacteria bacterium]
MVSFSRLTALSLLALILAGCAADGSLRNPFSSSEDSTLESPYYLSEFSDVPIPQDMTEDKDETYISFAPSGLKCGVQHFSGRVEAVSLMNSMRRNMAAHGWILRALLRSRESILVFEKADSVCTMHIIDGRIYTSMILFMSARLDGDAESLSQDREAPLAGGAGRGL